MTTITIRIFSSAGRIRLDVCPGIVWDELIRLACQKLNAETDDLVLSDRMDGPAVKANGNDTLGDLKIQNGIILYARAVTGVVDISGQYTHAAKAVRLSDIDINQETKIDSSPVLDEKETLNENEVEFGEEKVDPILEKTSKSPNFDNFDAWLKKVVYNIGTLPLLQDYKAKELVKGMLFKVPPSITLKHQAYRHVDHVELMNVRAIQNFVSYWMNEKEMSIQRLGILYGYYSQYDHYDEGIKAVVEAIYEPPQFGTFDQVKCNIAGVDLTLPDSVASDLGLERIGLIYTHLPRANIAMDSHELILSCQWSLRNLSSDHYSGYPHSSQVVLTVSPDLKTNEPVTNAFMPSDLALAVVRDGLVQEFGGDPRRIKVTKSNSDLLVPEVLESGKAIKDYESPKTDTFDVDWLIVRLNESAPKHGRPLLPRNNFPIMGRTPIKSQHVVRFMKNAKRSWTSTADWNFLLQMVHEVGRTTVTSLCHAIVNRSELSEKLWTEINE